MTTHEEGALTARTVPGPALYFHATLPAGTPKAMVGFVHGYADHGARYAHVMNAWAERGIGTVAIDLRGHGRADGPRGYCSRFDEYLDDVAELSSLVQDRASGAPTFLCGHSFGGLVTSMSILTVPEGRGSRPPPPWRGLLLSAPYFGLALQVSSAKLLAGRVASRVAPKLGLASGLKGKDLTHDPVEAKKYDDDPLVFPNARARWFRETQKAQERAFAMAPSLRLPFYEVFGTKDPVAKCEAGRAFYDAVGSSDKTWDGREGLFHEVLMETSWRDIADKMASWILERA